MHNGNEFTLIHKTFLKWDNVIQLRDKHMDRVYPKLIRSLIQLRWPIYSMIKG